MKSKNLRRLSILVTAQTAYHLDNLARMAGYQEIGRVVDKLTREHMIAMKGRDAVDLRAENRVAEKLSGAGCQNRKHDRRFAGVECAGNQNHRKHLTGAKGSR